MGIHIIGGATPTCGLHIVNFTSHSLFELNFHVAVAKRIQLELTAFKEQVAMDLKDKKIAKKKKTKLISEKKTTSSSSSRAQSVPVRASEGGQQAPRGREA